MTRTRQSYGATWDDHLDSEVTHHLAIHLRARLKGTFKDSLLRVQGEFMSGPLGISGIVPKRARDWLAFLRDDPSADLAKRLRVTALPSVALLGWCVPGWMQQSPDHPDLQDLYAFFTRRWLGSLQYSVPLPGMIRDFLLQGPTFWSLVRDLQSKRSRGVYVPLPGSRDYLLETLDDNGLPLVDQNRQWSFWSRTHCAWRLAQYFKGDGYEADGVKYAEDILEAVPSDVLDQFDALTSVLACMPKGYAVVYEDRRKSEALRQLVKQVVRTIEHDPLALLPSEAIEEWQAKVTEIEFHDWSIKRKRKKETG